MKGDRPVSRESNLMNGYMHQVYLYFPGLLGEVVHAREYVHLMLLLETNSKYDYFYNLTNNVLIPIPKSDQDLDKESFKRIFPTVLSVFKIPNFIRSLSASAGTGRKLKEIVPWYIVSFFYLCRKMLFLKRSK